MPAPICPQIRKLVEAKYEELGTYRATAEACNVAPNTVRNIILGLHKEDKKKPGPQPLIDDRQKRRIKRKLDSLASTGQQVTARKLKEECSIQQASIRTVRRTLRSMRCVYAEAKSKVVLSADHRKKRVAIARKWIQDSHPWNKTAFSDEKRFNLDGPDSWSSWMHEDRPIVRNRRQQGGGNVQVWGILMPGPFLFVFTLEQTSKSADYIAFLDEFVKPLLDNLMDEDYIFQQDNASIHVSAQTLAWMAEVGIKTMAWPARSPDLNIIENVWSLISSIVYDGPQFTSKADLWTAIQRAVEVINTEKRDALVALYESIPKRLLDVIDKKGAKIDY